MNQNDCGCHSSKDGPLPEVTFPLSFFPGLFGPGAAGRCDPGNRPDGQDLALARYNIDVLEQAAPEDRALP